MDSAPSQPSDAAAVERCLSLLKAKDDTSRFVGLTILLALLKHSDERALLRQAAASLDPRFLDRMLRSSSAAGNKPETEVVALRDLAINITRAFALSLGEGDDVSVVSNRIPYLVAALPDCSEDSTTAVLETLAAAARSQDAAVQLLEKYITDIVKAAPLHPLTLDTVKLATSNCVFRSPQTVKRQLNNLLKELIVCYGEHEREKRLVFLSMLRDLLLALPAECSPADESWVHAMRDLLQRITYARPSREERRCCVSICSSILQVYPARLLFAQQNGAPVSGTDTPFAFLFVQLVTIDIRASFSSLVESIGASQYEENARAQAGAIDILAEYLMFLLTADDFSQIGLEPDALLRLRNDIGETFSLGIEFLRDIWDSSSEAAQLQNAKLIEGSKQEKRPAVLANKERDPVVISMVRALSLWIRDDEGLRKDAAGLTDVFLDLWDKSPQLSVDYRPWLVAAFHGIVEEKVGVRRFSEEAAWERIWADLKATYLSEAHTEDAVRLAIDEATLLVAYVQNAALRDSSRATEVVDMLKAPVTYAGLLELEITVLSLASACVLDLGASDTQLRDRLCSTVAEKLREVRQAPAYVQCEEWLRQTVEEVEDDLQFGVEGRP